MLTDSPSRRTTPDTLGADAQRGAVSLWALLGVAWILFVGQAWTRWVLSDTQFGPAPIQGPDVFDGTALVVLRVIEVVSLLIAAATIWVFLIKPLIVQRKLTLDGMIVIGSLLASGIDPLINYFHYTFAWNAHALNAGSWLAFFPLHQGPTRYAEGLAWFVPQYLYLGIGLAAIECRIILALRRRYPSIPQHSVVQRGVRRHLLRGHGDRAGIHPHPGLRLPPRVGSPHPVRRHALSVPGVREHLRRDLRRRIHLSADVSPRQCGRDSVLTSRNPALAQPVPDAGEAARSHRVLRRVGGTGVLHPPLELDVGQSRLDHHSAVLHAARSHNAVTLEEKCTPPCHRKPNPPSRCPLKPITSSSARDTTG